MRFTNCVLCKQEVITSNCIDGICKDCLFDPLKPATIEEIEQNEDILWQEQENFVKL